MERRGHRPSGYEQRARAIKMANIVEREMQRQRNMVMAGMPVKEALEVLFQSGQIRERKRLVQPPYEQLIQ